MTIAPTVTIDDLRQAELNVKRAEGRVATKKRRLAEEEAELVKERERLGEVVEQYRQQHCDGVKA